MKNKNAPSCQRYPGRGNDEWLGVTDKSLRFRMFVCTCAEETRFINLAGTP